MKHVVMLFALLLTLGLLTACDKDEPESWYDDDLKGFTPYTPPYCVTYEAEWVMDRQVIDKTTMRVIDDLVIEIDHMPNEVLLRNFSEIQGLPIFDSYYLTCYYEHLAHDEKSLYVGDSYSISSIPILVELNDGTYYIVKAGGEEYVVGLDYQIDGTYDHNTDQWTLKLTVNRVNLYETYTFSMISSYTFDPALTLMLISTKRLN